MVYNDGRYRTLFIITMLVALVLVVIVAYILLIKPSFNGYVIKKQIEAKDLTLLNILNQVQQQGYAQITYGNQTLVLVPYAPQEGQAQQSQQEQTGQA